MAKSSTANKKRKSGTQPSQSQPSAKRPALPATNGASAHPANDDDEGMVGGLLLPEELETAVDVLKTLSGNPDLFKGKELKAFKGALWDVWRSMGEATGTGQSFLHLSLSPV